MGSTVQPSEVPEAYGPDDGVELQPPVNSDQLMVVRVDVAPNATLRVHDHPRERVGYVVSGSFIFTGDDRREVGTGDGYYVPPGHDYGVEGNGDPAIAVGVFTPARTDYEERFDHLREQVDA